MPALGLPAQMSEAELAELLAWIAQAEFVVTQVEHGK